MSKILMGLLDIFKTERSKIHLYGETIVKHALGETIVIGWPCLACLLLFYGKVTHSLDAQIRVSLDSLGTETPKLSVQVSSRNRNRY